MCIGKKEESGRQETQDRPSLNDLDGQESERIKCAGTNYDDHERDVRGKEARRVEGEEETSFSLTLISAADFLDCCRGGYCLFGRKTPSSTWFCPLFSSSST